MSTDDYVIDAEEARAAARWALWQHNLVVFDTETTGLYSPEIIEVAAIDGHGNTLIHERLRPLGKIDEGATEVHGLTLADLRGSQEFWQVHDVLSRILKSSYVCIYNSAFDELALRVTAGRWGLGLPKFKSWCVMEAYARHYGEWSEYHGSYKWQKLVNAAYRFGVDTKGAHGALADCHMTLGVMRGMAR